MSKQYVIIRDMSEGNAETGEAWQETKIFDAQATLDEVMEWAMDMKSYPQKGTYALFSDRRIQITLPHNIKRFR